MCLVDCTQRQDCTISISDHAGSVEMMHVGDTIPAVCPTGHGCDSILGVAIESNFLSVMGVSLFWSFYFLRSMKNHLSLS